MVEWVSQFTAHAQHIISAGNLQDLTAIFLIAYLTEFGIPFPLMVDSVLFLLGYQIELVWLKAIIVILILLVAREAGAAVVYWFFHFVGNPVVKWLKRRFPGLSGFWLKLTDKFGVRNTLTLIVSRLGSGAPMAASGLGFRAPVTIALSRLTPGLLSLTSIASGTLRFRYRYFASGIGISSLFSDCTVIILGIITGYGLRELVSSPPPWLLVTGIIVNLGVVLTVQYFIWRRVKGDQTKIESTQKLD
jgi:membrane protein DedA with SNARE-associated domain